MYPPSEIAVYASQILIVVDDSNTCMQMKWALAQDFEVLVAHNRPDALTLFNKERPAVVTLDLGLPPDPDGVEEGFQTLGRLLQTDAHTTATLRILLLSSASAGPPSGS